MDLYTKGWRFIFGILQYIMILRFHLDTIYFDNKEYCYVFLNSFTFTSVAEGNK